MPTVTAKSLFARGVFAAALGAAGLAQAGDNSVPGQTLERLLGGHEIGERHELPTAGGITAIEVDGKLYVLSANGRYLFDGTLRDLWHNGRVIGSMADVKRYALRLDLDALGIDFSRLVSVDLGGSGKQVTVFIAPGCPSCKQALDTLAKMPQRYTVRVVIVPRPGGVAAVHQVDCTKNPERRRELAITLPPPKAGEGAPVCEGSQARLTSTLLTAQLIGVDRVPFIVAPDGRVSKGMPTTTTLAGFLDGAEGKAQ